MLYSDSYSTWKKDLPTCQNCGKPSDDLVMLGNGWDYLACPKCAAEAAAIDLAETGCLPQEFELVSPSEMPQLKPIQAKPVQLSAPEFKKPEVA